MKTNALKLTLRICCWLFGAVFIFSGFVKAIDPAGGSYKFQEYFAAMGLESFGTFALILAVLLSAIEMVIGLNLLFGVRIKETSIAGILFMLVMTPLTLWIALKNPVPDCGCFGDALIISNKATFVKNIVLLIMIVAIFCLRKHYTPTIKPLTEWVLVLFSFVSVMALSHVSYHYLPMVDFRPFKIGINIPESMKFPDSVPRDEYNTTFILSKNGVKKEFTLENYPDSTWTFIEQKTTLIKEGYKPPIHDFSIQDPLHGDITDTVLNNRGYTFLLIAYDMATAKRNHTAELNALYRYALQNRYAFYCLTGSTPEVIDQFMTETSLQIPLCIADPTTLKTVIRSNPGLVLLHNGTVVNHWPNSWLPSFRQPLSQNPADEMPSIRPWMWVAFVSILYLAIFIGLRKMIERWNGSRS